MEQYLNIKIAVPTKDICAKVLNKLTAMGFEWRNPENKDIENANYLYVEQDGEIMFGFRKDYFNSFPQEEVHYQKILNHSLS